MPVTLTPFAAQTRNGIDITGNQWIARTDGGPGASLSDGMRIRARLRISGMNGNAATITVVAHGLSGNNYVPLGQYMKPNDGQTQFTIPLPGFFVFAADGGYELGVVSNNGSDTNVDVTADWYDDLETRTVEIAQNAISNNAIANNAISEAKVANDALTQNKFSGVFPAQFNTLVITNGQSVGTSNYAGGAVASVSGNVEGNVNGSVGSISGVTFPAGFDGLTVANIQSGLSTLTAQQVWEHGTRTVTSLSGLAVDVSEQSRLDIAAQIETELVNDATGEAFMQAIADKLLAEFELDDALVAVIATACRNAILDRILSGNHDSAGTPGRLLQSLPASGAVSTITTSAIRTELTTELGRIDAAISTRATPAQVNEQCDTALADYGALRPTVAGAKLSVNGEGIALAHVMSAEPGVIDLTDIETTLARFQFSGDPGNERVLADAGEMILSDGAIQSIATEIRNALAGLNIVFSGPVLSDGSVCIIEGDSYEARPFVWTIAGYTGPSLDEAPATLKFIPMSWYVQDGASASAEVSIDFTITQDGSTVTVSIAPTLAQLFGMTKTSPPLQSPNYKVQVIALPNTTPITLVLADATRRRMIGAIGS